MSNIILQKKDSLFPIVGIGTVATAFEVLQKVLSEIKPDSGMAYIIMEDLDYPQSQNLAGILAQHTKIPVVEIVNEISLEPNHIYVVPENNFLVTEDGTLKLQHKTRSSQPNNCFDLFFDSLSSVYKSYTVGLIISGNPLDGCAGLKKIKEMGGASLAALHKKGLPQNADNTDFIDHFLAPSLIASKLSEIQNSYSVNHAYQEDEDILTDEDEFFKQIIDIIHKKTGTDFHHYKHPTLRRRIAKRMVTKHQESIEGYLNLLKNNTEEQNALFHDILIPVTYFFRDEPFLNHLSDTVFPALTENPDAETLRIWCAGCSTGEEAYSLAICLDEYLQKTNKLHVKVQIFASDISKHCISKARAGIYSQQDVKNISSERLQKYFIKRNSGYHVNKIIRDHCVFAVHDLTKDAPFSKIDLISCRNVLIYFDTFLQNRVLTSFHYALREKGFLFLGKSEAANNVPDLFTVIEKQQKIYIRKKNKPKNEPRHFDFINSIQPEKDISLPKTYTADYKKIASDILLEQYSPAAVIINEEFEIVHFHGDTSPFLQPASGKPSFNILNMVGEEIGFELHNAILKTRNEKKNFSGGDVPVKKQNFLTSFEVIFLPSYPDLLLIIFCKKTILHHQPVYTEQNPNEELEKELNQLRGDFKRVTEEQQIYFEELQTTNEELQTSNEELLNNTEQLQIKNEQLTASAQELRSNNEELTCVNDELQDRREKLALMQNFYESIVNTIREPLIIIDKNTVIKSANPAFYKYFKTIEEETEGFSIFEIGNSHWNTPEFKESVLKKLSQQEIVENFKIQFDLGNGVKKTVLLNASPIINSIPEGMILLALEDISDLEQSNNTLENKNLELISYSKQLESFTEAASHTLLEPGRKIYMFGKKVLDSEKTLSESGRHNLKRLLSSAENLNQLVEDVIDYSKINFTEKKFKKTDLNIVLKRALSELKNIINSQKAEVITETLPTLSIIPHQIQKLFTHLITNSIKYTKKGETPKIKISAEVPLAEEISSLETNPFLKYIRLTVTDNGVGFTKDYEALIFKPFYKLHSNDQFYGSGLGLTLVKKIVMNHQGFIRISSKPAFGTSVFIYLPV
ncbi:CheR family methyltransferase [Flavobacterium sp. DGU38]|uniref:protein-glutamate O-methyltransferase n=1 Tax=Flavobacterium calami TaxID=3139144 RepID=A0ABU9IU23_9FLAO